MRSKSSGPLSFPWWSWLPRRRYRVMRRVDAADLVPDRLPRKALVTVENDAGPAWVAFDCPCRGRHRLLIPLSMGRSPHWLLTGSKTPSLHPSVDSESEGKRCHFSLIDGRIHWASRNHVKGMT